MIIKRIVNLGELDMLRTIMMGTSVYVQGNFVCSLPNGRIRIKVGETEFSGQPV